MWFDQMAVPADAPNPEAAHRFIDFMLVPENIAAVTNYVWYANGNLPSQEYVDPEILSDPAIYPDPATMETLWVFGGWDAKTQRTATRLWTRIKSGT